MNRLLLIINGSPENTALLYELEYAESKSAASWKKIPAGGEASLTDILDKQPESVTEITLYVRKAATGSAQQALKPEIKNSGKAEKPDPIRITNVTKDSYLIKAGTAVSGCEYGISRIRGWRASVAVRDLV